MTEERMAKIRQEIQQIRKKQGFGNKLILIAGIAGFVLGIVLFFVINNAGHKPWGGPVMALFLTAGFLLILYGISREMKTENAVISVMEAEMQEAAKEYVTFVPGIVSMGNNLLDKADPVHLHHFMSGKQIEYKGLRVVLSTVSFRDRSGDRKKCRYRSVLTLPMVDCGVQIHHLRAFDLLKGREEWCGNYGLIRNEAEKRNDEAFNQIFTEEWTQAVGCFAIETRMWNGKRVVDIALNRQLLSRSKKVDDPQEFLQWYRHELQTLCQVLDMVFALSIIQKE